MKLSLNWIKEYVELPSTLSMEQLAHDLTMRTVEVEGVIHPAKALEKIVVGEITRLEAHPDADRLRVAHCDMGGGEEAQIVCGGSNLYEGQKVVIAKPGSQVRWHGEGELVKIKRGKLRGVVSEGMICAADELSLGPVFPSKDEAEIMDLTELEGAIPGRPLADCLGLDDLILDIDNKSLTNRPDLWGHYGMARELAAIYQLPLKPLPQRELPGELPDFPIQITAPEDCPRYTGTVYAGIQNEASGLPMRLRLHLLDQRPINFLVDLTNWVMLATGQACHVFDLDHISSGITVRRAAPDEALLLLDGQRLALSPDDLVIADEKKALALAGVMGGEEESVSLKTSRLLLEVGTFNPRLVRRSAGRYGLRTEAEIRFEKGLDTQRVDQALGLFHALLLEAQPQVHVLKHADKHPAPTRSFCIDLKADYVAKRLGERMTQEQAESLLAPLGMQLSEAATGAWQVAIPSWRATGDIQQAADLVEELARMMGYENFSFQAPSIRLEQALSEGPLDLQRRIKEYLAFQAGMQEVFHYPWIEDKLQELCGIDLAMGLRLAKPPAPEMAHLRQSLLPGLLETLRDNAHHQEAFTVFEIAEVFSSQAAAPKEDEIQRAQSLALLDYGKDAWTSLRRLKGALEAMPRRTHLAAIKILAEDDRKAIPAWADPYSYAKITDLSGVRIGGLGLLSVKGKQALGLRSGDAAMAEIDLGALRALPSRENRYERLPKYPQVEMDFSILVEQAVTWEAIAACVQKRVDKLRFLEEYRGSQVPSDKRSYVFRVWLSKPDGTLSQAEIDERRAGIAKEMDRKLGAVLRS